MCRNNLVILLMFSIFMGIGFSTSYQTVFAQEISVTNISSNSTGIINNTTGMMDDAFDALKDSFGTIFSGK